MTVPDTPDPYGPFHDPDDFRLGMYGENRRVFTAMDGEVVVDGYRAQYGAFIWAKMRVARPDEP